VVVVVVVVVVGGGAIKAGTTQGWGAATPTLQPANRRQR
jgi:hypothetical protein